MGGKRRQAHKSTARRPSAAALQRQVAATRRAQAAVDKAKEALRLSTLFQEILNLHRQEFPPVERPVAGMPPLPDAQHVRQRHEKEALHSVSRFNRSGRAAARQQAEANAQSELDRLWQQAQAEQARVQAELDQQWHRLVSNDPDTVLGTLTEAFEDNEAPAAPVGVDGDEVLIMVLVPGEETVPERLPATTQAGNITLRKLPKGERSALYLAMIAGHVLATLREAFAVAAGIGSARVIAVRTGPADIYGHTGLECMLAGRWPRAAFNGVRWQDVNAGHIISATATELIINEKRSQLLPVDLTTQPDLTALLKSIDTSESDA